MTAGDHLFYAFPLLAGAVLAVVDHFSGQVYMVTVLLIAAVLSFVGGLAARETGGNEGLDRAALGARTAIVLCAAIGYGGAWVAARAMSSAV